MTCYLLNSAVMTAPGTYRFRLLDREAWAAEVRRAMDAGALVSAIGYPETAEVLGRVLDRPVPVNRVRVELRDGDVLYVARLRTRIPAEAKGRKLDVAPEDFEYGIATYREEEA